MPNEFAAWCQVLSADVSVFFYPELQYLRLFEKYVS